MNVPKRSVLVTGGGGYVGAVLVPKLLNAGHRVTVLDTFWYGQDVLAPVASHASLRLVSGDIRDRDRVKHALVDVDTVIHLACISNDPSFDLAPDLGRAINLDAFAPLVHEALAARVARFIYASSSSVYGVKDVAEVTEDESLEPLTDYSKYKAQCEDILHETVGARMTTVVVRPATVCGVSPRQRLDLIHNILTNHAVHNRRIKVFGGAQKRPGIHIEDMTDLYAFLLTVDDEHLHGEVFNAGYQNHTVDELAQIVREEIGDDVVVQREPTDDLRSYHISSRHLEATIGFRPRRTLRQGMAELRDAFLAKRFVDPLTNPLYFNIAQMKKLGLA